MSVIGKGECVERTSDLSKALRKFELAQWGNSRTKITYQVSPVLGRNCRILELLPCSIAWESPVEKVVLAVELQWILKAVGGCQIIAFFTVSSLLRRIWAASLHSASHHFAMQILFYVLVWSAALPRFTWVSLPKVKLRWRRLVEKAIGLILWLALVAATGTDPFTRPLFVLNSHHPQLLPW